MTRTTDSSILYSVTLPEVGGDGNGARYEWEADAETRTALAVRFGCVDIPAFAVKASIKPLRRRRYFRVAGTISARVVQTCVVSLEPVVSDIERAFELVLVPEGEGAEPDAAFAEEEYEPYSGNTVDLGEIGAVELALALDPYPRAPNVSISDLGPGSSEQGYEVNEKNHIGRNRPFESLAALKRKG